MSQSPTGITPTGIAPPGIIGDADLASGAWEPCGTFLADGAGSAVCAGCGWLGSEHPRDAEIRHLPARAPRSAAPRRLAS